MPTHATVQEAAKLMEITQSAVYRLIQSGELTAFRVGNRWMITLISLCKWKEKP